MKPMLAADWDPAKVKFPVLIQPKYDGVRGLHINGRFTGRSLKPPENRYSAEFFNHPDFAWLDGELTCGPVSSPDLITQTTSALKTHAGEPKLVWYLFDYLDEVNAGLPYVQRYKALSSRVRALWSQGRKSCLRVVPMYLCNDMEALLARDDHFLSMGMEGSILRNPNEGHKSGRSSVTSGGLLRIKRFMEEDAEVLELLEGNFNGNEATKNELGNTARSSHKENMVPNGMVGTLICRLLKDVVDPSIGRKILSANQIISVSPGKMEHQQRKFYFEHPQEIVGHIIKIKFFPKGIKDKPRFPTYSSFRLASDR